MRDTAILLLLKRYVAAGILCIIFLCVLWKTGYALIYKKILHGEKNIKRKQLVFMLFFIFYVIVLIGATLFSRGSHYANELDLHLFSSYKEAWYNFSVTAWRNLILNILLFVPMGFLLPFLYRKNWQFGKVYLTGMIISVLIEAIQFAANRGIVEIDDVLNNTLGTMIGYGVWILFTYISTSRKKKGKLFGCLLYQLPLLLVCASFTIIFSVYSGQELGNLPEHYILKYDMRNVVVDSNFEFSTKETKMPIYRTEVADEAEAEKLASELFEKLGTSINYSQKEIYEDTAVYTSENQKYSLWINFKGLNTWFTEFNSIEAEGNTNYSKAEVLNILKKYGIELPEECDFTADNEKRYVLTADMIPIDGKILNGTLTCTIGEDQKIQEYNNDIISYNEYTSQSCITEREAYELLKEGKFRVESKETLQTITIENVTQDYRIDSKGFYQPVYEFEVMEMEEEIIIPAVK